MGREIRRVPKGWEHPSEPINQWNMDFHRRWHKPDEFGYGLKFQPMYDDDYESAAKKWVDEFHQWERGEHERQQRDGWVDCKYYWEYAGGPPDEEYYRPVWKPEEMTHYQIYETVSEGTPVSPVFETLEEMRVWLIGQGYSPEAAAGFVEDGWVPSGMFIPGKGVVSDIECAAIPKAKLEE